MNNEFANKPEENESPESCIGEFYSEIPYFSTKEAGEQLDMTGDLVRYYVNNYMEFFPGIVFSKSKTNKTGRMKLTSEHIDTLRQLVTMKREKLDDDVIQQRLSANITHTESRKQTQPPTEKSLMAPENFDILLRSAYAKGAEYALEQNAIRMEQREAQFLAHMQQRDEVLSNNIKELLAPLNTMLEDYQRKDEQLQEALSIIEKMNVIIAENNMLKESLSQSKEELTQLKSEGIRSTLSRAFKNSFRRKED